MNQNQTIRKWKGLLPIVLFVATTLWLSSCGDDDEPSVPNIEPIASFTVSDENPLTDIEITMTNESSDTDGTIVSFSWDFGNGESSTEENPSVSYAEAGVFTITLTVTDDDGATASATALITVTDGSPTASFTTSVTESTITNEEILSGEVFTDSIFFAGMEITFTDASTDADGSVQSYSWDFGDGTTSTEQNPTHTYSDDAQTFEVALTVTDNDSRSNTFTKKIHIAGLKWNFLTNAMETGAPAIDAGGNIYICDRSGFVYKLSPDGTQLWSFEAGDRCRSSVALSDDEGTVYVGSEADKFYALNASSGTEVWSVDVVGNIDKSSPAVDPAGNLYVGTEDGILYAFDNVGSQLWIFDGGHPDGAIQSSPLYYNGNVFVALDSVVYSLNATNGSEEWKYDMTTAASAATGARYEGHFAISADGGILYGGADYREGGVAGAGGAAYALNVSDGNEIWHREIAGEVRANSPVVTPNGDVIFPSEPEDGTQTLMRLDGSSGAVVWLDEYIDGPEDPTGLIFTNDIKTGGALGTSGIYYIGSNDDHLYLIDSETGDPILRVSYEAADHSTVPAIGPDGTVYFGNRGSFFYAMYFTEGEMLESSGWSVGGSNKNQDRK